MSDHYCALSTNRSNKNRYLSVIAGAGLLSCISWISINSYSSKFHYSEPFYMHLLSKECHFYKWAPNFSQCTNKFQKFKIRRAFNKCDKRLPKIVQRVPCQCPYNCTVTRKYGVQNGRCSNGTMFTFNSGFFFNSSMESFLFKPPDNYTMAVIRSC